MSKTNEQLLIDYKKSNKERRKKILEKAGYALEADYIAFLLDEPDSEGSPEAKKLFKHNLPPEETDMLDQVIAFDTTGSMSGYINAVKAHVTDLIPKLFAENKNLRLKIIAFGDYCDMRNADNFGAAYQESPLTDNANELIKFVKNAQHTSGGDSDEFYELVLKKVIEETPWRPNSRRALLLIADCGPHPVGYSYPNIVKNAQIDWKQEALNAVRIGMQIDTLNCGPQYQSTFYRPLSEMTDGVNIPFSSQHKTQEIVGATIRSRGASGSAGTASFMVDYTAAVKKGDEELVGSYKALYSNLSASDRLTFDALDEELTKATKKSK